MRVQPSLIRDAIKITAINSANAPIPGANQHEIGLGERDCLGRRIQRDAEAEQDRENAADGFRHRAAECGQQSRKQRATQHELVHQRRNDTERHHAEPDRQACHEGRCRQPRPRGLLADQQPQRQHRHRMRGHEQRMNQPAGKSTDAERRWMREGRLHRQHEAPRQSASAARSCQPRQENNSGKRDQSAGAAHRQTAGGPSRQQADRNAGEMQQAGRHHETGAVGECIRSCR
jgi:hypothetical protein